MSFDYFWGVRSLTGAKDYVMRVSDDLAQLRGNLVYLANHVDNAANERRDFYVSSVFPRSTLERHQNSGRATIDFIRSTRTLAENLANRTRVIAVNEAMSHPGLEGLKVTIPYRFLFDMAHERRYWEALQSRIGLRPDTELVRRGIDLMRDSRSLDSVICDLLNLETKIDRMILRRKIVGWSVVGGALALVVGAGLAIGNSCLQRWGTKSAT